MNVKHMGAGLMVLALGLAGPAWGQDGRSKSDQEARQELERARQEVEKARVELQKATRDLARSMAKVERDNPRAQYFEYMTDPDRAVLGVLVPDDKDNAEARGVRLIAITPGGGAEKAGLKAGDLLTAMNGVSLAREGKQTPSKRLREQIRKLKAGDEVKVEYERDGRRERAVIKTTAPEPELAMAPLPMGNDWLKDDDFEKFAPMVPGPMFHFRGVAIRGLELAKLDEDLGAYFKTTEGVLVVKAPKGGALNLRSGDVIQRIDGKPVAEPVTVIDMLRSRGAEQTVKIDVMRQGRRQELTGTIPMADARTKNYKDKAGLNVVHEGPDDGK